MSVYTLVMIYEWEDGGQEVPKKLIGYGILRDGKLLPGIYKTLEEAESQIRDLKSKDTIAATRTFPRPKMR